MLLFMFLFSWDSGVLTGAVFRQLLFLIGLKSNYNKIEKKIQQRTTVDYYNIYVFYYL